MSEEGGAIVDILGTGKGGKGARTSRRAHMLGRKGRARRGGEGARVEHHRPRGEGAHVWKGRLCVEEKSRGGDRGIVWQWLSGVRRGGW